MSDYDPFAKKPLAPARDALGADQQTALLILRRVHKRLSADLSRVNSAIGEIETLCVHDFQNPLRCGPKIVRTCTRCGSEEME